MTASLTRLRSLYLSLGVETAAEYGPKRMADRLRTLEKHKPTVDGGAVEDPALVALFDRVCRAVRDGEPVEIEDDVKPERLKAEEPRVPKPRPVAVYRPGVKGSWAAATEHWKTTPRPFPTKGPGLAKAILVELKHAGSTTPKGVTVDLIVGVLVQIYPDRDPLKMRTYTQNMVFSRLRQEYGVAVERATNADGKTVYWVQPDPLPPRPERRRWARQPAPEPPAAA